MFGFRKDFYIAVGGEIVAQIEFEDSEQNIIVIQHTLVTDRCRGKGLGKELVNRVVLYARKEKKYIKPVCPFAQMILANKTEYQDVVM